MGTVLATVLGTDQNYPFTHSLWHLLISLSLAFLVMVKSGSYSRAKVSSQTTDILSYSSNEMSEAAAATGTAVETATSPRQTTFLEMPASTASSQTNMENSDRNSLMKRLSYLQKFSALIAKNDS